MAVLGSVSNKVTGPTPLPYPIVLSDRGLQQAGFQCAGMLRCMPVIEKRANCVFDTKLSSRSATGGQLGVPIGPSQGAGVAPATMISDCLLITSGPDVLIDKKDAN